MQLASLGLRSAGGAREILDDIRRIVQILRESSISAERKVGLSGAQLFVLQALAAQGELTINQLAEQTLTHQSSVSLVASKLVEKGLAKKHKPERGDGRCVVLTVTPKGRLLVAKAPPMAQEYLVATVQKMRPAERTALGTSLGKLVHAMEASHLEPQMLFEEEER